MTRPEVLLLSRMVSELPEMVKVPRFCQEEPPEVKELAERC